MQACEYTYHSGVKCGIHSIKYPQLRTLVALPFIIVQIARLGHDRFVLTNGQCVGHVVVFFNWDCDVDPFKVHLYY